MWLLSRRAIVLGGILFAGATVAARPQGPASQPPGATPRPLAEEAMALAFHAVSYVETAAGSSAEALMALRAYREAAARQDGCVQADVFEQIGRPGHWVVIETWRDAKSFDSRDAAAAQRLTDALKAIRISGWDQRPYKTVSVAAARGPDGPGAVSVISHVDVAPNPAVAPMLARLAQTSRQEAGNLRFDVLQHTMRGNHFTVVETWRDQAALDVHTAAAHTRQYRDEVLPLTGSPLDERVFKSVR
jgi:quinol monooxygenase YgiN